MQAGWKVAVAGICAASLALAGCNATVPKGSDTDGGGSKTLWQTLGCLGGGAVGAWGAKMLAASEAKRLKLSAADAKKRERGYMVAFALMGCGGGAALAGTAYAKLSEAGRQAREKELLEAAASAQPRTYKDPENPKLTGVVTPQPVYADVEKGRECRDIVDQLADEGQGEPIVVKYCRDLAGGGWAPVTA